LFCSDAFQSKKFTTNICDSVDFENTVNDLAKLLGEYLKAEKNPNASFLNSTEALFLNSSFTPGDGLIFGIGSRVYSDIQCYIFAHELSHIFLNHDNFDKGVKKSLVEKGLYSKLSQVMELEADKLAFKMLFRKDRKLNIVGDSWLSISTDEDSMNFYLFSLYSSISIFFRVNMWLDQIRERFLSIKKGQKVIIKYDSNTHPADSLRMLKFKELIFKYFSNGVVRNSQIDLVLNEFEERVVIEATNYLLK